MTKSTKTIIIAAAITMLSSFPLYSASIEEFQTKEYYGSGGLELINAAEAYSKGYTGKGITIGINDQPVNLIHESFSDKTSSKYIGSLDLNGIDWDEFFHGNHVGGIAAGSKNGKGMHGVAFDAIKRMYFKLMSEYEGEPENASSRGLYRAVTTPQQMAQILTFINLPAAQAGPALNAVTLNAAAQSMTLVQRNSMTNDI